MADRGPSEESAVLEEREHGPLAAEIERVLPVEDGQTLQTDLAIDAEQAGGVADKAAMTEWTDGGVVGCPFVEDRFTVGADACKYSVVFGCVAPVWSAKKLAGGVHVQMMVHAVVHVRDKDVVCGGDQSKAVDFISDFGRELEEREERSGALRLVKTCYNR